MTQKTPLASPSPPEKPSGDTQDRRDFLSKLLMGIGLLFSYGVMAVEGILFILPPHTKSPTRRLYAGHIDQYHIGAMQTFYDLQGTPIMVKRDSDGLRAFSSVCPHLGCKVHWQGDKKEFFCPCHGGVFNQDGIATAGPPADAGQKLFEVPITVDKRSGIVYLEVKDVKRRTTA